MRIQGLFIAVLALSGMRAAGGAVSVTQEAYHGWKGAYRLSNGTAELVFVPQVGRILRYGFVGERNILWENPALAGKTTDLVTPPTDWQNYGGDKLWPSPQSAWGWPPDPISDSGPQTVHILPNKHLLVTGPAQGKYGVQFQREIALAEKGTAVTIRNTMTNRTAKMLTFGIWEIAQADNPDVTTLPESKAERFPKGYTVVGGMTPRDGQVTRDRGLLHIQRLPDHAAKIGGNASGNWVESAFGKVRFRMSGGYESGGDYPDDGCAQEVYTSDDPNRYVEMELLAPLRKLKPAASTMFVTLWSLTRSR